ncbi:MAG: IS66 family transposase [Thermoplasmata archaeon]
MVQTTPVPDVLPNTRFSIRIMLMVAYYKIIMRMSLENVSKMMQEMYNLKISEGEIQKILSTVSDNFEDLYGEIQKEIRNSGYRHMDSTSWRIDGSNEYLWTFVTRDSALFSITDKNNYEVPESILGAHKGVDIHDRYSAFETFAKISKNEQQYCWAHIIRDAKELEGFYGEEGGRIHRIVKRVYEKAKKYNGKGTDEDISKLYGELEFQLNTQYDKSKCRKYVEHLLKRKKEWLFNFVKNAEVEGTNNRAERALRPSVIYRKVCGGSRSKRGAKAYSMIYSIFYTMKLRGKNIMEEGPPLLQNFSKNT